MGCAKTVVILLRLALASLAVRLLRIPGPDLARSEIEGPPVGGADPD